jgi:transcription termination/antitermination protein NusG
MSARFSLLLRPPFVAQTPALPYNVAMSDHRKEFSYYVVQVMTSEEEKFLGHISRQLPEGVLRILWPRRKLFIRRRGRRIPSLAPIFPGYLFLEAETLPPESYWVLRKTPGFIRFLDSNQNVRPLSGVDRELIVHFLRFGPVVETSRVHFDENARIRVIEGPLKGLEGNIVKVDRRKGRAKVKLDLYNESFLVDFGFETIQPSTPTRRPIWGGGENQKQ